MCSPSGLWSCAHGDPQDGSPPFSGLLQLGADPAFGEFVFSRRPEIAAALMQSQTAKFSMSIRWSNPPGQHGDSRIMTSLTIASRQARTSARSVYVS